MAISPENSQEGQQPFCKVIYDVPYIISPSGDTYVHVGPKPATRLLVSSKVMETASPIFAIMVTRARRERRAGHHMHIFLKFDTPFIIRAILAILHEMDLFFAHDWDIECLWELAQVAQNYHCATQICEFVEGLIPVFSHIMSSGFPDEDDMDPVERYEEQLKLVAISMAIDSDLIFTEVTKTMIEEYDKFIAEEVGLDWSIVDSDVYDHIAKAVRILSEDYKDDVFEKLSQIKNSVSSMAENIDKAAKRCPLSLLDCFQYAIESAGAAPSPASVNEVRGVVKQYIWCLGGMCESDCATCDALKGVREELDRLLDFTEVGGLCLSDWKGCASTPGACTPPISSSEDETESE